MKVKVRDVRPNPYRNIDHYPLNKEKIMTLTKSIEKTGFWDNLVAREVNGEIQIAYGHHRIEALRLAEGFGYDFEFELPIKDIDDATMIQIMANENMQEWEHSLTVTDETVKVAKEFLEEGRLPGKRPLDGMKKEYQNQINATDISEFLGWNKHKVTESLKRMNLIEEGRISKKAVENFSSERKAEYFASAITKVEKDNVVFTPEEQEQIAKELVDNDVSRGDIKKVIEAKAFEKKHPNAGKNKDKVDPNQAKIMQFEQWIIRAKNDVQGMNETLKDLESVIDQFKDVNDENIINRASMVLALEKMKDRVTNILNFIKQ